MYLLLGPSTALYLQWVCGGLDALVRQSSTRPNEMIPMAEAAASAILEFVASLGRLVRKPYLS
jgi:hypothetical protein